MSVDSTSDRERARQLAEQELGVSREYLCREPWESYYILRRGVLPCCHGYPIAPMEEWRTAWNSAQAQEIRRYLAQGRLSPYCLKALGCPVTQRYLAEQKQKSVFALFSPLQRPTWMRRLNRALGGLPARLYRRVTGK